MPIYLIICLFFVSLYSLLFKRNERNDLISLWMPSQTGFDYSPQVKDHGTTVPLGYFFLFFSTEYIFSWPFVPSCSARLLPQCLSMSSWFFVENLLRILPFSPWVYQLFLDSMGSAYSCLLFFCFHLGFIKEFVFSVSSGHPGCRA